MGRLTPPVDLNPYASPGAAEAAMLPVFPRERWPELDVKLVDVRKGVMQRWLTLGGHCEAEIHYNGWVSGEVVLVNKQVRGRGRWWDLTIVSPQIEFFIDSWSWQIPARIEVRAGLGLPFLRIKRFRLTVAGHVVYDES